MRWRRTKHHVCRPNGRGQATAAREHVADEHTAQETLNPTYAHLQADQRRELLGETAAQVVNVELNRLTLVVGRHRHTERVLEHSRSCVAAEL